MKMPVNESKQGLSMRQYINNMGFILIFLMILAMASCAKKTYSSLIEAVQEGDSGAVKIIVSNNSSVKINEKDINGATPLMWAAYEGNIKIIKILLESGADINASDNFSQSVLCYACGPHGSFEAIKYLIDNGANVNPDTNGNDTPLMHASMWVSNDAVKYLLKKGARVNDKTKQGDTALLLVGSAGDVLTLKVVKTLIEAGADYNCKNTKGETIFLKMKKYGRNEVTSYLSSLNGHNEK